MKTFHCSQCGQRVFFENVRCEACGATLGHAPDEGTMLAFAVDEGGVWQRLGSNGPARRPCQNYAAEQVCNWTLPETDPHALCLSCRTTDVIPALSKPENRTRWGLLEAAKRRLFYTLLQLGLPAPNKADDAANGLSFQFLEDMSPEQRVLTGHDEGLITLNIAEADDAERERMRTQMHEPYRTLLGHFRHESGHYYWDRLIRDTPWIDEYRQLFGDERADYAEALQRHYAEPVADWPQRFISVYASSHPWEDWAECWAHYLHLVDGLDTAAAWGLNLTQATPGGVTVIPNPIAGQGGSLEFALIEQWLPVAQFLNAMNRSLGLHDGYPFVVPAPVVAKLDFIHRVVGAAARGEVAMNFAAPAAAAEGPVDVAPANVPTEAVSVDGAVEAAPAPIEPAPAPSGQAVGQPAQAA